MPTDSKPPSAGHHKVRWRRALLLARRLHLYCGLAMIPWVILYAVTGWLFNHPTAFSDDDGTQRFALRDLPETKEQLPSAAQASQAVVDALVLQYPDSEVARLQGSLARYERGISATSPRPDGTELRLSIDLKRRKGALSKRPVDQQEVPAALAGLDHLDVGGLDAEAFAEIAATGIRELGGSAQNLTLQSAPRLVFFARIDNEAWRIKYTAKSGTLAFARVSALEVSTKRVLARLHMTHVYPAEFGAAWLHTLVVDLVAGCLLLWCVTGLMMWWQMRRFRRIGLVVLGSALVASLWILGAVVPGMLG